MGTRSTRTTHPKVLKGFTDIISGVADRPLHVRNPFIWKTKQDIVEIIRNAQCSDLVKDSISCAHANWGVEPGKTHCGECSQCIDRRFAVLAAGMATSDPSELYGRDLLTSPRGDEEHKLMIASYLQTAECITKMRSPADFLAKFGMAARAFDFFPDRTADSVAQDLYSLHRRHAEAVISVVDKALATNATAIRAREHDPECLIRLVSDSGDLDQATAAQVIAEAPIKENFFIKEGHAWRIRFAGGPPLIAMPSKGIAYLRMLLSSPGKPIRATELVSAVAERREELLLGDAGEVLDKEALTAYMARIEEIKSIELPKAEENQDLAWKDQLLKDLIWYKAELKRTGLHGARKEKDNRNRVRNRVGNAIKRAIDKQIEPYDKRLAAHLQPPHLRKGYSLTYMPDEGIDWEF